MAAMYALYHGPQGLRHIAERTHKATLILAEGLSLVTCSLIMKFVMNVRVTYQSSSCYHRTYQGWTQTPEWNLFWHTEDSLRRCCQRRTREGCAAQDQPTNLWWRNSKCLQQCVWEALLLYCYLTLCNSMKGLWTFQIVLLEWFQLGVSLDETVTERDLDDLLWVFGCESSAVSIEKPNMKFITITCKQYCWFCVVSSQEWVNHEQYFFLQILVLLSVSGTYSWKNDWENQRSAGKSFQEDQPVPHPPSVQQVSNKLFSFTVHHISSSNFIFIHVKVLHSH